MSNGIISWPTLMKLTPATREALVAPLFAADTANSIGPFLYATMCDSFLLGVMAYQLVHWLRVREAEDRKLHRYMVCWVVAINIAASAL